MDSEKWPRKGVTHHPLGLKIFSPDEMKGDACLVGCCSIEAAILENFKLKKEKKKREKISNSRTIKQNFHLFLF